MSKIIAPTVPVPLNRERAQNGEDYLADLFTVSGVEAWVKGHTDGKPHIDTEEATLNPAPLNPHGRLGHDHSGGIYGKPFFRTIASLYTDRGGRLSGNWTNQDLTVDAFYFSTGGRVNPTGVERFTPKPFVIWPPNCDPGPDGAYNWLGIVMGVDKNPTAVNPSDTHTYTFRNLDPYFAGHTVTFTLVTPAVAGEEYFSSDDTERLPMRPGYPNLIELTADIAWDGSAHSPASLVEIFALEFGVFAT